MVVQIMILPEYVDVINNIKDNKDNLYFTILVLIK